MIEINLLPEELRAKAEKRSFATLPKLPFMPFVKGFVGVIIGLYLLISFFVVVEKIRLRGLLNKWESILPEKKQVDIVKDEIAKINNRVAILNKLMAERTLWSKKLNEISDSMVPGVWLTKFSIVEKIAETKESEKDKGKKPEIKKVRCLSLNGSVVAQGGTETAVVGRFIKSLKSNGEFFKDFKDIELGSINRMRFDDSEIVSFGLYCYFNK